MSATIHYRKTAKSDPSLKTVNAPSVFIQHIERAFGGFPLELDAKDIPVLRGMAAIQPDSGFDELIELIDKFGSIAIYASY